ncbi:Tigger transposable element-derived protein [Phytophthora megakarya]|uniref:Tigger transposable element-derived protein n=1 Tax=Phytophthora megakarya TaxID=4795 RepID=A0A225V3E4_9STRA|nr:Tigger transposable element-derived protein [Phytophthora megakarya]
MKLHIPPEHLPRLGRSWLRRFQERYGFDWRRSFGESDSVKMDASVEDINRIKCIVKSYLPRNVFNMDEMPRGSICKNASSVLKQDKARLTVAVCVNADSSVNLPIHYLGQADKPRWLKKPPSSFTSWYCKRAG